MSLPFTTEQFFEVFARYNEAVWPAQWLLVAMALAILLLVWRKPHSGGRIVAMLLALLWTWMAAAYHLVFFSAVNPAAPLFAIWFFLGAGVFVACGVRRREAAFMPDLPARSVAGGVLVAYALVGYPALGYLVGHRYPAAPTFGLPCPTTIFTIGILLLSSTKARLPFVVPVGWSLVGSLAAFQLGVVQDYGLLAAGLAAVWALVTSGRAR